MFSSNGTLNQSSSAILTNFLRSAYLRDNDTSPPSTRLQTDQQQMGLGIPPSSGADLMQMMRDKRQQQQQQQQMLSQLVSPFQFLQSAAANISSSSFLPSSAAMRGPVYGARGFYGSGFAPFPFGSVRAGDVTVGDKAPAALMQLFGASANQNRQSPQSYVTSKTDVSNASSDDCSGKKCSSS